MQDSFVAALMAGLSCGIFSLVQKWGITSGFFLDNPQLMVIHRENHGSSVQIFSQVSPLQAAS
jgi:hypothetical protein